MLRLRNEKRTKNVVRSPEFARLAYPSELYAHACSEKTAEIKPAKRLQIAEMSEFLQ